MQSLSTGAQRIELCEQLLGKYSPILHENHFILTSVRQQLIEMYGRVEGYTYNINNVALLDRKLAMCRHVMQMLDIFHPGLTRSRALLLYEMHVPLVLGGRARLAANTILGSEYKDILLEAVRMLTCCASILQWEDVDSAEAAVNAVVSATLKQLQAEADSYC